MIRFITCVLVSNVMFTSAASLPFLHVLQGRQCQFNETKMVCLFMKCLHQVQILQFLWEYGFVNVSSMKQGWSAHNLHLFTVVIAVEDIWTSFLKAIQTVVFSITHD